MKKIDVFIAICSTIGFILLTYVAWSVTKSAEKMIEQTKNKIHETIIVERDISPIPYDDLGEFILTFYTHTGNRTKTGVYPKAKRTIAVDPNTIPLGSVLYIESYGVFIAEDTGGKIKGNRADIFVNTKQEAINLGVKKARVYKIGG